MRVSAKRFTDRLARIQVSIYTYGRHDLSSTRLTADGVHTQVDGDICKVFTIDRLEGQRGASKCVAARGNVNCTFMIGDMGAYAYETVWQYMAVIHFSVDFSTEIKTRFEAVGQGIDRIFLQMDRLRSRQRLARREPRMG